MLEHITVKYVQYYYRQATLGELLQKECSIVKLLSDNLLHKYRN